MLYIRCPVLSHLITEGLYPLTNNNEKQSFIYILKLHSKILQLPSHPQMLQNLSTAITYSWSCLKLQQSRPKRQNWCTRWRQRQRLICPLDITGWMCSQHLNWMHPTLHPNPCLPFSLPNKMDIHLICSNQSPEGHFLPICVFLSTSKESPRHRFYLLRTSCISHMSPSPVASL